MKLGIIWELIKPRILILSLIATGVGYFMGGMGLHSWVDLFWLLLGVSLSFSGAAALNQYLEVHADGKMDRTKNRPLPEGRATSREVFLFGVYTVLIGSGVLIFKVHLLPAFLSLLLVFLYVLVYTPAKAFSPWNTTIGAIPGALPPLIGWSAIRGTLEWEAWVIFLIFFLWQHPHFYAIAWVYRKDYKSGGFKMLGRDDERGASTFVLINFLSILMLPVSLLPYYFNMAGKPYLYVSVFCGLFLLVYAYKMISDKTEVSARRYFKATVFYLPALMMMLVLDASFN